MRNIFLPHAIEKPRVSMRAFVLGAVSLALAIIPGFAGAELKKSGNPLAGWHIYSEADSMTDELSCVALFNDKKEIQLTRHSLALNYRGRGGIQGYKLRFDVAEPMEMMIPSDAEQRIGAVVIKGEMFERILSAKRLRVQALTFSSVADDDIDLTGVKPAIARMQEMGCK